MLFGMQILRRSSFTANPWKNGGGITHEAIRVPAGGESFRWRVSVAQIDVSGPFSDFAGYHRVMVLLRGAGVRLEFDSGAPASLSTVGDMLEFDGALKADCRLVDGPCTDLNLMVAKSMPRGTAAVLPLVEPHRLPTSRHETTLVFGITGGLWVECTAATPAYLDPWDLAILPEGDAVVRPDTDRVESSLVFLATLDDN
jgi:environmental stress-induced protein Ves